MAYETDWHVYPEDDIKEHLIDSKGECWCHPVLDDETQMIWIHNSLDRREDFERVQ